METLIGLLGLAVLIFILGGSAVAWYSFSKIRQAEQRVNELTKAVLHLKSLIAKLEPREKTLSVEEDKSQTIAHSQKAAQSDVTPSEPASLVDTTTPLNIAIPHKVESPKVSFNKRFEQFLENNGLLWIGAAILALGGVFLAKYSIEADLISIEVRLALGGAFAAALVFFAEYLYRRKDNKSNMLNTCAAIASGGVITGFALVLVTFSYYHFISPVVAFLSLALIAMLATTLALRYGPLLAAIGIVGAYAVPALVSSGSNNVVALLMYVNFVSTAAIWVAQRVNRSWLWWQSFSGHFIWILISIFVGTDSDIFIIGLSLLLAQY